MTDHEHDQSQEPGTMMLEHPTMELWPQYPIVILGLWLITSPFTFGYESVAMTASDIADGTLLIVLAMTVLVRRSGWANYANGFVGFWLLFAPLILWARRAPPT